MQIFDFALDQLDGCETLFPPEIDWDSWVFYHATSSVFEAAIETEGLVWRPGVYSQRDLEAIVKIYKSINWYGTGSGGYAVLHAFSLQGDFRNTGLKPIFFREYSGRSLLYASKDWAGGESATAVRAAFSDLDLYLNSKEVRDEHYEQQRKRCIDLVQKNALPSRVIRVDLEWLRSQVDKLKTLRERCQKLLKSHTHGVVYAIKFNPEDIPFIEFSDASGLRSYRPLAVDRIVAKARLFTENRNLGLGQEMGTWQKNRWRMDDPSGLLQTLEKYRGSKDKNSLPRIGEPPPYHRPEFVDESAGKNETIEIALKFGTPEMIKYLRNNPLPKFNAS